MSAAATGTAAGPGQRLIRQRLVGREVHQLDEGSANVQSNVTDVTGVLMGQYNAWSITVPVPCM